MAGVGVGDNACREKKVSSNGINVSSSQDHSSYYSINGGKVDLIIIHLNLLPARASPFLCMTEATSMVGTANRGRY